MSTVPRNIPEGWPLGEELNGPAVAVRDAFTGEAIAQVRQATLDDVTNAVEAARTYLPPPRAALRAAVLDHAAMLVRDRIDDFAQVIAMEAGKPLSQARGEVTRCIDTLIHSAVEARTLIGEMRPIDTTVAGANKLAFVVREPIGVVGAITPFNFPLNLVAHKIGPAIAAGCPVVLKPAPQTPLSALGLAAVLEEAGLPTGMLAVLPGDVEVGQAIVSHPHIPLISFTGSDRVGNAIRASVPAKRVLLELGNATPVIVAADADVDDAARRVARSAFTHAGQSCVSVQRVYVERGAYERFTGRLSSEVAGLVVGDPLEEHTDVGPLINQEAANRVLDIIQDAVAKGGRVIVGGSGTAAGGTVRPTVVAELPANARLASEEVFGPVVGVAAIEDLEEGVALANASPFGLQAGIFTGKVDRAIVLARRLEFGGVLINETPTFRADQMPYGGVKQSGNTREGPHSAVYAMSVEKLVVIQLPEDRSTS